MIELAGGDGDGAIVGEGEVLGVGDQQGEVGQAVEAAGQAVGGAVERGQGVGGEEGGPGAGGREPAEDVGGRLGLGQRAEQAAGRQAVGQAGGKIGAGSRGRRRAGARGRAEPSVAKLSRSRRASNVAGSSIRWASSTIRSGRRPCAAMAASWPRKCRRASASDEGGGRPRLARAPRPDAPPARPRASPGRSGGPTGRHRLDQAAGQQRLARARRAEQHAPGPGRAPARTGAGAARPRGSAGPRRPTDSTVSPNGRRSRPKWASYTRSSSGQLSVPVPLSRQDDPGLRCNSRPRLHSDERLGQAEQGDSAGLEDLAGAEDRALAGQAAVVDQDGGIDRAVEDRRAQAGEQGAAVEQDEVELAAEPGQGARPGRARPGNRGAGRRRRGAAGSPGGRRGRRSGRRPGHGRSSTTSSSPTSGRRPRSRASIGPVRSASTSRVRPGWRARARARVRTRVVRPSARWQLVNRMTLRFWRSPGLDQELGQALEPVAPLAAPEPGTMAGHCSSAAGSQLAVGAAAPEATACPASSAGDERIGLPRGRRARLRGVRRPSGGPAARPGDRPCPAGRRRGPGPRQLPSWAGSSQAVVGQQVAREDHRGPPRRRRAPPTAGSIESDHRRRRVQRAGDVRWPARPARAGRRGRR